MTNFVDIALGWPGVVGGLVYLVLQILLDRFSPLVRYAVILVCTLSAFVSCAAVAKLQGNGWGKSIEGGIIAPFIFVLIDLSVCSMLRNCGQSAKGDREFNEFLKQS